MIRKMNAAASELNGPLLTSQKAYDACKRAQETKDHADQRLCEALESVDVETVESVILFKVGALSMSEEVMGHLADVFLEIIKKAWSVDKCLALGKALSQAQESEEFNDLQKNLLNSLIAKLESKTEQS